MPASTSVKFFSSTMPGAPALNAQGTMISVLDACLVNGFGLQTVSSASVTANVCTLTLPTAPAMLVGSVALVAGADQAAINGEHRVTAVGANTVGFEVVAPDGAVTGASMSVKLAPAGWLKPFADTNKGVYTIDRNQHPEAPVAFVRVSDTESYCATVQGYETMTDADTGTSVFPSGITPRFIRQDTGTTSPWFIVADSQMVYLGFASYADSVAAGPRWGCFGAFKGSVATDPYRFILGSHAVSNTLGAAGSGYSPVSELGMSDLRFVMRGHTGAYGHVVGYGLNVNHGSGFYISGGLNAPWYYPDAVAGLALHLLPFDLVTNSGYRGRMPGVLHIPQIVNKAICPSLTSVYLDDAVPGFEGRTVAFFQCPYNYIDKGCIAFDLTGPWEH